MGENGINFIEKLAVQKPLKGVLNCRVYRHEATGEKRLIEVIEDNNLIVNDARDQMAHLIAGDTADRSIKQIGFGLSSTEPTVDDTSLTNPFLKDVDGFEYPTVYKDSEGNEHPIFGGQVQFNWSLALSEGNGKAIKEFGLFTKNGKLFARRVRVSPINKESDISLEGSWTIIF